MSETRRVDLSSAKHPPDRQQTGDGKRNPKPANNKVTPITFEQKLNTLIPPANPTDTDPVWSDLTCHLCNQNDVCCAAVTSCAESGTWCWICQLKLALRSQATGAVQCCFCRDYIRPAYLSRHKIDWLAVCSDIDKPFCKEAIAHCEDSTVFSAVKKALKWICWFDECNMKDLGNEGAWKSHMAHVHNRKVCEICFQKKKAEYLPIQHYLYDPKDIPRHRREGDPIPHVKCPACSLWCYDDETFFNHWSKADDHVDCQFCQRDGHTQAVFSSFQALQEHHRNCHYICDVCNDGTTFGDYQGLLVHRATAHAQGKKGVVNLADLNAQGQRARSNNSRAEEQPAYDQTNDGLELWPDPMLAATGILLLEVKQAIKSIQRNREFYDQLFNAALESICGPIKALAFKREFESYSRSKRPSAEQILGALSHLLWTGYWDLVERWKAAFGQPKEKNFIYQGLDKVHIGEAEGQEIDENVRANIWPKIAANNPLLKRIADKRYQEEGQVKATNSSFIPCEVIAYFILHLTDSGQRQEMINALEVLSKHAPAARRRLKEMNASGAKKELLQNIDSLLGPDKEDEIAVDSDESVPRDPDTGYYIGKILGRSRSLPIKKGLPFVTAAMWALNEFLMNCGNTSMDGFKGLSPQLIEDMMTHRRAFELGMCTNIENDLKQLIGQKELELFLSLRPQYMAVSRTPFTARRRDNREMNERTKRFVYWRIKTLLSQRWGDHADRVFKQIKKPQLWLLKEYCRVSTELMPHAVGVLPELTGGIPLNKVADSRNWVTVEELRRQNREATQDDEPDVRYQSSTASDPPLPGYTGYNTWTQQAFRPGRVINEEQFPPLPQPAAAPPGLTGSPSTTVRPWMRRSTYEPELQVCGTCFTRFDPDANECPACHTLMYITTSQRAQNLMAGEEYPSLSRTPASRAARPWGLSNTNATAQFVQRYSGRSGPPKRF